MWPLLAMAVISLLIIADRIVVAILHKLGKTKANPFKFLRTLELIAQLSPVLGFLGTVTGIMKAFEQMSFSSSVTIQTVAGGMYEALYTTAFGLVISIVASVSAQLLRWWLEDDKKSC